jgi:hypothetical protein
MHAPEPVAASNEIATRCAGLADGTIDVPRPDHTRWIAATPKRCYLQKPSRGATGLSCCYR